MSGPVAVDATVRAMVQLINRVAKDTAFRQLCESDMAAAVAQLETAPAEGASFEYSYDAGGHVLLVHRGGETTTVSLTADGRLTIDNDALGVHGPADESEMSDAELLAVAGGDAATGPNFCDSQPTRNLIRTCKAIYTCFGMKYWPNWDAVDECTNVGGPVTCIGFNTESSYSIMVPCDQRIV